MSKCCQPLSTIKAQTLPPDLKISPSCHKEEQKQMAGQSWADPPNYSRMGMIQYGFG